MRPSNSEQLERDNTRPLLSVICVFYDMHREARRTLYTLSAAYQRHVSVDDYEVIAVDNGSPIPVLEEFVTAFGPNFRLISIADAAPTPVPAINQGLAQARGDAVAIMVDGARMLSPCVLFWTLEAFRLYPRAAVSVPSWHLGPDVQNRSVALGYNKAIEDEILNRVDWHSDGYNLFDCCERLDPSCEGAAWFDPMAESNFIACSKIIASSLGGFEARFTSRGGGACNLDFFRRAVEDAGCPVVCLLGEGTFHQVHGGVSTNVAQDAHPWFEIEAEYREIRGRAWSTPRYDAIVLGSLSYQAKNLLKRSPHAFTVPATNIPFKWLKSALADVVLMLSLRLKNIFANTGSRQ